MENLETICNDKIWITYETGEDNVKVYPRCQCGRFLTHGSIKITLDGVKFKGWKCKKHGEIEPFHLID